jgi:hypothetical protein
MECEYCNCVLTIDDVFCPNCKKHIRIGLQKSNNINSSLDAEINEKLIKKTTSLIKRADSVDKFMESELNSISHLSNNNIQDALHEIMKINEDDLSKLDHLLTSKSDNLSIKGISLSGLLSSNTEEGEILKKGVIFLKHRRYSEAIEWWSINRQHISRLNVKFEFLLLIMESFSYSLKGDIENASRINHSISEHSLFEKYKK